MNFTFFKIKISPYSRLTPFIGGVALWFFIVINFTDYNVLDTSIQESLMIFIIFFASIMISYVIWYFYFFYTKNTHKGKIKILIGIQIDDDEQKNKVKKNFINKMKKSSENEDVNFEISELKDSYIYFLNKSNNKSKYIKKINKRLKANLYIYGTVDKIGSDGTKDNHVLNISYMLFHREVSDELQKRLQLNLNSTAFESKFSQAYEMEGFSISSEAVYFITNYLIGLSAVLGGAIEFGYNIHNKLFTDLRNIQFIPNRSFITSELKSVLSEEASILNTYYSRIGELKKSLGIANTFKDIGDHASYFLQEAIYHYRSGNMDGAFISIKKSQKKSHKGGINGWRYSLAYLKLINKDYLPFLRQINLIEIDIKRTNLNDDFKKIFFEGILNFTIQDFDKTGNKELLFWIGYIYYHGLNNIPKAYSNLEKLDLSKKHILYDKYAFLLDDCKKTMGIK